MVPRKMAIGGVNPIDAHVGLRIRLRRQALGLSQEELCQIAGMAIEHLQNVERGEQRLSVDELYVFATRLEAPVVWFFEGLNAEMTKAVINPAAAVADARYRQDVDLLAFHYENSPPEVREKLMEVVRLISEISPKEPRHLKKS